MAFLFDIKRYSINDGPGIRVTVFFKGCPLACKWCHNPESISFKTEKLYNKSKCIGCGTCVKTCPEGALTLTKDNGIVTDLSKCKLNGQCALVCPTKAIEMSGRDYSTAEVMKEIIRETNIMDSSGGGVTFSGGEPMMYPSALKELLIACGKEGIHRAIDTAGYVKQTVFEEITPYNDLFLYDLKHMDSGVHKEYTGVPNELILSNLKWIASVETEYYVRIPLVKGVNTGEKNIQETMEFLLSLKRKPSLVGLLPYHNIASAKYDKLGRLFDADGMSEPSKDEMAHIVELFRSNGLNALVGG
jgi:pyruvate formate lyase activating enzyme